MSAGMSTAVPQEQTITPVSETSSKLRIGIIGAGGIAGMQMQFLKPIEVVELVAAADVNPKNLEKAKSEYGVKKTFSDWKQMLAETELDAVCVCTPNSLHAPATIDALNAGCHVLVEKPLAMNAVEGQQMLDAAKKNNKHLIIGFQWRFHPATQMMKQAADAGELGKILFARCQSLRRLGIPNWGVFGRKDLQGGGPMIDVGVHAMEMAHYVMGTPKPVAASGATFTYRGNKPCDVNCPWPNWDHKSYTVEDLAIGHVRFDNGAVLHVETSFAAYIEKNVHTFQIMGEKGGGQFDPPMLYKDLARTMYNMKPNWMPDGDMWAMPFQIKMEKFVDTVFHGKPSEAPAEHGLMIQKMIDAIYKSAEVGREVVID